MGVRVAPLPQHMPRWSNGDDAGPSTRSRGSTPRRGTQMPGSRAVRRPAVTRKAGVRAPPWQRIARWPRIKARGCRPRHGGESPSRASMSIRCDENGDPSSPAAPRGTGDSAASPRGKSRRTRPRPTRFTDRTQVVVVQRRGYEHATLAMRVRLPPATPPDENEGGADMPAKINDRLVSWRARSTTRRSVRPRAGRLSIVAGHVPLMSDAHVGTGATVGSVIPTKGAVIRRPSTSISAAA